MIRIEGYSEIAGAEYEGVDGDLGSLNEEILLRGLLYTVYRESRCD